MRACGWLASGSRALSEWWALGEAVERIRIDVGQDLAERVAEATQRISPTRTLPSFLDPLGQDA